MGVILPFVSAGAFEPNDIEAMSLACEEVCHYLHINGDARARETIAARVIELTQRGERCPTVFARPGACGNERRPRTMADGVWRRLRDAR
ncbi:hypothetical protein ACVIWV_009200 [Bradyrhizobium diazoefficiens]|jgi:hypothetical protein